MTRRQVCESYNIASSRRRTTSLSLVVYGGLCLLLTLSICSGAARAVEEFGVKLTTRLVKIIKVDDSGLAIGYPRNLAYDRLYNELYLLTSGGRIVIYDDNYFPQGSIGEGRGATGVEAMALGPKGKLYLARKVYGKDGVAMQSVVTIYNIALLVDREILLNKIPALAGFNIQDLAVASDGKIYLVGYLPGTKRVYKGAAVLDNQGSFLHWLLPGPAGKYAEQSGDAGAEEKELSKEVEDVPDLESIYIDGNGRIYLISPSLSHIFVHDSQEAFLFKFGVKGGAEGKVSQPRAVAVDYPRRLIYLCDYMRHTILVYDYDTGYFVYEFGGKGRGPLWFQHPVYLTVDAKGMVVVADLFNLRVQVINPSNPSRPIIPPDQPLSPAMEASQPLGDQPPPETPPIVERQLPQQLVYSGGMSVLPVLTPLKPIGVPQLVPREIAPDNSKRKIVAMPPPAAALVAESVPVVLPKPITAPVDFILEPDVAAPAPAKQGGRSKKALRAVVGVYGPVAAMLGVASWLVQRNH